MGELTEIAQALGVPTGEWEGSPSLKVRILAAIEQLSAERDAARAGEAQAAIDVGAAQAENERLKMERWRFSVEVNSRLGELTSITKEAIAERDEATRWAIAGMTRAQGADRYIQRLQNELARFAPPDVGD